MKPKDIGLNDVKIQKILLTLTERHRIGCISGTGGHRMRTVKEVSELTGISVRTLHYYDEIGLFEPTVVSEAGYLSLIHI